MQPTNNPRPVMDVTARHKSPTAPSVEIRVATSPVRQAPVRPEDALLDGGASHTAHQTATSSSPSPAAAEPSGSLQAQASATTSRQTDSPPVTPVGAIVVAVFVMLLLAGIAVTVYLKSQTPLR